MREQVELDPEEVDIQRRLRELDELTLSDARDALIAFIVTDPHGWDLHVSTGLQRRKA